MKAWHKIWGFCTDNKNALLKVVISTYPAVAAVWLAFSKDRIVKGTVINFNLEFDYQVFIYWLFLCTWIFFYVKVLVTESVTNKKNISDLRSAIFRAPNPDMFGQYFILLKTIEQYILSSLREKDVSQEGYHIVFKNVLETICSFTNLYTKRDVVYGANIMFFEEKFADGELEKLKEKENWVYLKNIANERILGVIKGVDGFMFSNKSKDGKDRTIPLILMPIIKNRDGKVDEDMLLPGACSAAAEGMHLFNDVENIDGYFHHLGITERNAASNYFNEKATDVKGIASFAIPISGISKSDRELLEKQNKLPIVGVLNIDSGESFPLGREEEYHATYLSLIMPILYLISPYLQKYRELYLLAEALKKES